MRKYFRPSIESQACFETSALGCAKCSYYPQTGSHHFWGAYDTFTGHLGPGMGFDESVSPGQTGVGYGPGGTSQSYPLSGLCNNWVNILS